MSSFRVWGSNKASSLPFCAKAYKTSLEHILFDREGGEGVGILNTLLDLDSAGLYRREVDPGGECEVLACPSRSPASSQATAAPVTTAREHSQTRVETWRLPETWKHKCWVEKNICLLKKLRGQFSHFSPSLLNGLIYQKCIAIFCGIFPHSVSMVFDSWHIPLTPLKLYNFHHIIIIITCKQGLSFRNSAIVIRS